MENWVPSGKRLQFAIENDPIEIVDLPINSMVICHSLFCMFTRGYLSTSCPHLKLEHWQKTCQHLDGVPGNAFGFPSSFSDSNLFWTWIFPTKYELLTWGSWKNMDRKGVCLKKNWGNLCIQPRSSPVSLVNWPEISADHHFFRHTHYPRVLD